MAKQRTIVIVWGIIAWLLIALHYKFTYVLHFIILYLKYDKIKFVYAEYIVVRGKRVKCLKAQNFRGILLRISGVTTAEIRN